MADSRRYYNLVFEGGGVLGVAYIGAIRELNERGILDGIRGFSGSSVGSIMATALACRASNDFIEKKLGNLDMKSFKDDSINPIIDGVNLIRHYGFCKGDKLHKWCGTMLKELSGFRDLTFRQVYSLFDAILVIPATSLNRMCTVYFSHINYPDMPIRDAIRMSASIPYFFRAIHFEGDVFVDAGILNNYPLSVFDNNAYETMPHTIENTSSALESFASACSGMGGDDTTTHDISHTLGLKLVTAHEIHGTFPRVTNIKSFSENIFEAMSLAIANSHVRSGDWMRTIKINTGNISYIDFDLSETQKEWLIQQGSDATIEFLKARTPLVSEPIPLPPSADGLHVGAYASTHASAHASSHASSHADSPNHTSTSYTKYNSPGYQPSPPIDIPKKHK